MITSPGKLIHGLQLKVPPSLKKKRILIKRYIKTKFMPQAYHPITDVAPKFLTSGKRPNHGSDIYTRITGKQSRE
jgi:hypothetical protein